ncbi:MAG: YgaP-like transmembrane domain [Microbacteriaceae bacterium]
MFLLKFLGSTVGRWTRGIAGAVLLIWGLTANLVVLTILGAVVAAAGLFDFCIFAPLAGKSFNGTKFREQTGVQ